MNFLTYEEWLLRNHRSISELCNHCSKNYHTSECHTCSATGKILLEKGGISKCNKCNGNGWAYCSKCFGTGKDGLKLYEEQLKADKALIQKFVLKERI